MACNDPIARDSVGGVDVQRDGVTVALVQNERGLTYRQWRRNDRVMTMAEVDAYLGKPPRPKRFILRRIFAAVRGFPNRRGS